MSTTSSVQFIHAIALYPSHFFNIQDLTLMMENKHMLAEQMSEQYFRREYGWHSPKEIARFKDFRVRSGGPIKSYYVVYGDVSAMTNKYASCSKIWELFGPGVIRNHALVVKVMVGRESCPTNNSDIACLCPSITKIDLASTILQLVFGKFPQQMQQLAIKNLQESTYAAARGDAPPRHTKAAPLQPLPQKTLNRAQRHKAMRRVRAQVIRLLDDEEKESQENPHRRQWPSTSHGRGSSQDSLSSIASAWSTSPPLSDLSSSSSSSSSSAFCAYPTTVLPWILSSGWTNSAWVADSNSAAAADDIDASGGEDIILKELTQSLNSLCSLEEDEENRAEDQTKKVEDRKTSADLSAAVEGEEGRRRRRTRRGRRGQGRRKRAAEARKLLQPPPAARDQPRYSQEISSVTNSDNSIQQSKPQDGYTSQPYQIPLHNKSNHRNHNIFHQQTFNRHYHSYYPQLYRNNSVNISNQEVTGQKAELRIYHHYH